MMPSFAVQTHAVLGARGFTHLRGLLLQIGVCVFSDSLQLCMSSGQLSSMLGRLGSGALVGCICTARLGFQCALKRALLASQLCPLAIQCSVLGL